MKQILVILILLVAVSFFSRASTPRQPTPPAYEGFSEINRLSIDLVEALSRPRQSVLNSRPVFFETTTVPSIRLVDYQGNPGNLRALFVSQGFVDLMNHVSHAKAIDKLVEPGFFRKYVETLEDETGEAPLKPAADARNPEHWGEQVINEQKSNFNQMAGTVIAIELSHHYSGRFAPLADRIPDDSAAPPMNHFISIKEWEISVKLGAQNALDAGLSVEGLIVLYECIDRMPKRPPWAADFFHPEARFHRIMKKLEEMEAEFFSGKRE